METACKFRCENGAVGGLVKTQRENAAGIAGQRAGGMDTNDCEGDGRIRPA